MTCPRFHISGSPFASLHISVLVRNEVFPSISFHLFEIITDIQVISKVEQRKALCVLCLCTLLATFNMITVNVKYNQE